MLRLVCLLGVLLTGISLHALDSVSTNATGVLVLTNHFGDLNDDGPVDVRDLVLLLRHLNGTRLLTPQLAARADINQDSQVDDADQSILADMIAGRNLKAEEDFDGDELANAEEIRRGTNPFLPDTDGDGWLDGWEAFESTDPLNSGSHPSIFITAHPPVRILLPGIEDTNAIIRGITVMARPPVQVLLPGVEDTNAIATGSIIWAHPPVKVIGPPH